MSASNQQTLAESGATDRPPILKKGNYISWESRFRRPMITDPDDPDNQIPEPISKMTKANKKKYVADVKNAGYGGNGNRNAGRQNRNQAANAGNGQVSQIDESNQIV
ncbi:hypothetical protein Tco_0598280 [Tanacetum coccineum]